MRAYYWPHRQWMQRKINLKMIHCHLGHLQLESNVSQIQSLLLFWYISLQLSTPIPTWARVITYTTAFVRCQGSMQCNYCNSVIKACLQTTTLISPVRLNLLPRLPPTLLICFKWQEYFVLSHSSFQVTMMRINFERTLFASNQTGFDSLQLAKYLFESVSKYIEEEAWEVGGGRVESVVLGLEDKEEGDELCKVNLELYRARAR